MNRKDKEIVALIPAYNEEGRVKNVITPALQSDLISRVVVIDDGSTDNTGSEASQAGAEVMSIRDNRGKGSAIHLAIEKIKADIYVLLDADLIGLTSKHIENLVLPLLKNPNLGMVLGKFSGGRVATDLSQIIAPGISGQRAIRSNLAKELPELSKFGYAVEVAINDFTRKKGYSTLYVPLEKLTHVTKEEKLGLFKGFVYRLKMYYDILRYFAQRLFGLLNY